MAKLIVFLIAAAAFFYYAAVVFETTFGEPEPVACTMDAMQCSDGSWVGRTGPDCAFVCP